MAKQPKIPGAQMSSYDFRRPQKLMRFEAKQEHDSVKGCGDPNCTICMPKDGKPGDVRLGGGDDTVTLRDLSNDMLSEMRTFFIPFGEFSSQESKEDRAYRDARKKVEKYLLTTKHDTGWDEVVGNEAARTALIEAIEHPIKHADLYRHYGKRPLKGVLLYGPPGCGKTMFGKAAAAAVARLHGKEATLLKINGPEIQSPYVGVTEQVIRDVFAFARAYSKAHGHPLTIFIDEADAILPARDGNTAPWEASNVATFLSEMDGLETSGAFVILATNRPEAIDAALLRDGRCDRKIKVERPCRRAAIAIVRNTLAGAPLAESTPEELARAAIEFFNGDHHVITTVVRQLGRHQSEHKFKLAHIVNGAMLVGLVERAKGIAFRRDLVTGTPSGISLDDLKTAIGEILEENRGLNHDYALREFAMALPVEMGVTLQ